MVTVSRNLGSCTSSNSPAWLAYDHADRSMYVASPPSCVDVFPAPPNRSAVAIPVGQAPFGVAVDSATNEVFVTNAGSGNVSVIDASTNSTIASVRVGHSPHGIAFDPGTGDFYVANTGSNNLTVISGSTRSVLGSIPVGAAPIGVVADPTSGQVFVANSGSSNVTVLNATTFTRIASVPVGKSPYGLALDNLSDEVFTTNEGSNNLSVIGASTDTVIGTIPVVAPFMQLQGLAFNWRTGDFWVGAGSFYAIIVNAAHMRVIAYSATDPSGAAYDPDRNRICVTETSNLTYACLTLKDGIVRDTVGLTFHETGLPAGTTWSIIVNHSGYPRTRQYSDRSTIAFQVAYWPNVAPNGADYRIAAPPGYFPNRSGGSIAFGPTAITIRVSFLPALSPYEVAFHSTNRTAGITWYVNLTNSSSGAITALSGTSAWLNTTLHAGTYTFTVRAAGVRASHISPSKGTVLVTSRGERIWVRFS